MKNFIKQIINLTLICIIIYCGYNIYIKFADYNKADTVYSEIREIENSKSKDKVKEDLSSLNKDFVCWVEIDNTNIDYPVVQGMDNDFYLKKDFYGNESSSGSIFLDYRNDFDNDRNIILYGHNMKNKTMFNNLIKFKDEAFWKENNKIRIYNGSEEKVYEVFSAYAVSADTNYLITDFNNDDEFDKYINDIKSKSLYQSNTDVNSDDKIITLSTCSYEFNDARTVVHGKLIEN